MSDHTDTMKRCSKCREKKPMNMFSRNRAQRDGLCNQCKECNRAYREAHRCERLAYLRDYHEVHRDERKAQDRAYYEKNRERISERGRLYHEKNRDHRNARNRESYQLVGNPKADLWQEITVKHATRGGRQVRWSEDEDAYLAASTDRIVDDALELKRTYNSVQHRIRDLRRRGVTLARDTA